MNTVLKPVLCVVTSNNVKGSTGIPTGFWLSELTHVLEQLEKSGVPYELASVKGGEPPVDKDSLDMSDPINEHYLNDAEFQHQLKNTIKIDDADASGYSAVFFAGGHGTMWDFADSEGIQRVTKEIYENGGVVSAVCHGPAALVNVTLSDDTYLVDGKKLAAFTNDEEAEVQATDIVPFLLETALINHGALHHAASNWTKNVIADGRLITGQNPASAAGVGEELAKQLTNNSK
jgi:putative intracellular protease/amidase